MIRQAASEWVKQRSTRMWWVLFIVAAALTALSMVSLILVSGITDPNTGTAIPGTALTDPAVMRTVLAGMGSAQLIALLLGVVAFTGEFRHQTITDTFLVEPRRGLVIAAKAVVNAGFGVLLAVWTGLVGLAILAALLPARDHAPVTAGAVLQVLAGVALSYALYAVLGVAVGALLTNQIVAIVVALLWVMLVESLVVSLWPWLGKWLPGGAATAVLNAPAPSLDGSTADLLPIGAAIAVLLGYTVAFALAATATTLRRDIT